VVAVSVVVLSGFLILREIADKYGHNEVTDTRKAFTLRSKSQLGTVFIIEIVIGNCN